MLMETLRGYLTIAELNTLENLTISTTITDDDNILYRSRINKAEAYIDQVAGFHSPAHSSTKYQGTAQAGATATITLAAADQGAYQRTDQLRHTVVEIIAGTGAGQIRAITANTIDGVATVHADWTTVPDTTSYYSVYQMGKFPRHEDRHNDADNNRDIFIIPRQLKEAVAAQVVFIAEMGDDYFDTDESAMGSERIGGYSYSRGGGSSGGGNVGVIAPRAKQLMSGNGLINRTGVITNTDALQ